MMNMVTARLRYAQFFIICLLGISLYTMTQSMSGGILEFENNFWGRKPLISYFTNFRLALGDRAFQDVFVSRGGWLSIPEHLNSYQRFGQTSPEALKKIQQKIQKLYQKLRAENITLILVIAPNKTTIYPDKLPSGQIINKQSKLDALKNYLNKYGPPVLVDLRPALKQGRKKHDVYYRTNTHWNAYGSFIAYTEIMKKISKMYPQLAPKSINDFELSTGRPILHDISAKIGATSLLEPMISLELKEKTNTQWLTLNDDGTGVPLRIAITPNQNSPTLLMYMDSFGNEMKYFIAPHFSTATFILNHSKYPDLNSMEMIRAIKPNIVIMEFVERFFDNGSETNVMDTLYNELLSEEK